MGLIIVMELVPVIVAGEAEIAVAKRVHQTVTERVPVIVTVHVLAMPDSGEMIARKMVIFHKRVFSKID
jgi:hypothetical protein